TPDDGHFEYYAVATTLPLALPALYAFIGGRGAQEKTIAELKGEFALDGRPDPALHCQLSVAATQPARLPRGPQLSARHHRDAPPPLPEAHLRVYRAQHADPALPARGSRRPGDSRGDPPDILAHTRCCRLTGQGPHSEGPVARGLADFGRTRTPRAGP